MYYHFSPLEGLSASGAGTMRGRGRGEEWRGSGVAGERWVGVVEGLWKGCGG